MRITHHISFPTALLSLVLVAGASNTVLAQDSGATSGQSSTTTIPGNRDSAIEQAAQGNQNDDCRDIDPSVAGTAAGAGTRAPGAPDTLGTDARIDPNRVNCLDEHTDAPHEDNLRLGNPNTTPPSERTDLIIDEEQRNSTNGE